MRGARVAPKELIVMILTLLFVTVLVVGIVLVVLETWYAEWLGYLGITLIVIAGTVVICMVVFIALVPSNFQRDKITYDVVVDYLESVNDNDQMTGTERIKTLENITEINMDIMQTRVWGENPWVNWFYAAEYGRFELLSFDSVPEATLDVQLNRE
jgi:hypothetical protein